MYKFAETRIYAEREREREREFYFYHQVKDVLKYFIFINFPEVMSSATKLATA